MEHVVYAIQRRVIIGGTAWLTISRGPNPRIITFHYAKIESIRWERELRNHSKSADPNKMKERRVLKRLEKVW